MADETTQTGEDTSWWDLDIFADFELPSTSFDEPLEWPDALDWGDVSAPDGALQFPGTGDLGLEPIFPPTSDLPSPAPEAPAPEADTQWQATGSDGDSTMAHVTVLSGLGGGADASPPPVAQPGEQTAHELLPESLWGGAGGDQSLPPVVTTTMAAPGFSTEPGGGGWRRRFDIRHGNAAIIALISLVSLILLGMFMSVRARNQLPDTSQTRTTSDQIQVQGTLNTVPLTTTVTTAAPAINLADLVPGDETATETTGSGSGGGGAPATTAAPRPAGGGTAPTPAATATTAAPQTTAPPETTMPPTSSPDDTTATTRPRLTTTMPTATTQTTEFPMPSIPSDFTIPSTPRWGF